MKIGKTFLVISLVIMIGCLMSCEPREDADTIYKNGNIYTMDDNNPEATAIAVSGDKIIYVGNDEDVYDYQTGETNIVDLEGLTVIPGLTESHIHFGSVGENILIAPLDVYWLPLDELLDAIEEASAEAEPGKWITARGYNDAIWDVEPHRELLDEVSPDNPVVIRRYCGHNLWVNSKALERADITIDTPDPEAGTIIRDEAGVATGELISAAGELVAKHIPPLPELTREEKLEALKLGSDEVLAAGITTVHDATASGKDMMELRKDAYEDGFLKVRLMDATDYDTAIEMGEPKTGLFDDRYSLRWVKMFVDGSLGGRGAAMLEEYDDQPGEKGALRELGQDEDKYAEKVADLLEVGFSTRTHSIGDRGNRVTLNAFERAMEITGKSPEEARLIVEHAQILHPDDIERFGELGVIASMQPIHATEDMLFVEDRIGEERAKYAYAWRSLLDSDAIIAGGSDYSVSPFNPFYGLHAAVTRQDRDNNPPEGWYPEQTMTREEALKSYTVAPAYIEFSEDIKGSLKEGNLADFIVIDRDYFEIPAEEIHEIEFLKTVVGGDNVFEKEE